MKNRLSESGMCNGRENNMNEIQIFNNEEFGDIRTVEINGEPWFVAGDIAKALGYRMASDMTRRIDEEDKGYAKLRTQGGEQEMSIINESGLYAGVFCSSLNSAKKFKHWVTSEVLPSIRKTGGYNLPQTYADALRALADQAEQTEKLRLENSEMKPKADFFDTVAGSKQAISLGDVAKILNYPKIGRNKLFEILRDQNILQNDNIPYQKYIDAGYFRVIEQKYNAGDEVRISFKTLVYQKGVDYIRKTLNQVVAA